MGFMWSGVSEVGKFSQPMQRFERRSCGIKNSWVLGKTFCNLEVENECEAEMLWNSVVSESSQMYSFHYMTSP